MLLADTYIHVEFPDRKEFNALAVQLKKPVLSFAKEVFKGDGKLEYLLEEGTLIQRVRVIKTLAYLLGAIAGYHELRESVIDIYKDTSWFADVVIERFHKDTHTKPSDVIYERKIPSDVKRLYRVVQNADYAQNQTVSPKERRLISENIISDIVGLYYSNPNDEGVQLLLDNLPKKQIPELPNSVAEISQIDQRRRRKIRIEEQTPSELTPAPQGRGRRRRRYVSVTMI
jgi:hypothetical protein